MTFIFKAEWFLRSDSSVLFLQFHLDFLFPLLYCTCPVQLLVSSGWAIVLCGSFIFIHFENSEGSRGPWHTQSYNGPPPCTYDMPRKLSWFPQLFPAWPHTVKWVSGPFGTPWFSEPVDTTLPSCSSFHTDVATWVHICCWWCFHFPAHILGFT